MEKAVDLDQVTGLIGKYLLTGWVKLRVFLIFITYYFYFLLFIFIYPVVLMSRQLCFYDILLGTNRQTLSDSKL